MKKRLYGNGFGQFWLILAEIIGIAGSGYLTYLCMETFGYERYGEIFSNNQTTLSYLLAAVPAVLLVFALVFTIIGAAGKKRGASLTGIIFVVLAVAVQGAGYLSLIADYAAGISFDAGVPLGKTLSLFAHYGMTGLALFAFIGGICVLVKKKTGAVVFGILALICGLAAAGLGTFLVFTNQYNEPTILLGFFGNKAPGLVDNIFFAGRFIYIGLFALAMFVFAFFRKADKVVEEKKEEDGEGKKADKKDDKKDDDKHDDDHHDDGNGGNKNPDVKVINDPFNDRIIIEFR